MQREFGGSSLVEEKSDLAEEEIFYFGDKENNIAFIIYFFIWFHCIYYRTTSQRTLGHNLATSF